MMVSSSTPRNSSCTCNWSAGLVLAVRGRNPLADSREVLDGLPLDGLIRELLLPPFSELVTRTLEVVASLIRALLLMLNLCCCIVCPSGTNASCSNSRSKAMVKEMQGFQCS